MEVERLADGLWRWTVAPPVDPPPCPTDGKAASVYLETREAVVLFDPSVPPADTPDGDRFWRALDRDVDRLGLPLLVLLTHARHVRSTADVVERYGTTRGVSIGAAATDRAPTDLQRLAVQWFEPPFEWAGGVVVCPAVADGEAVYEIRTHGAVVVGDATPGASSRFPAGRVLGAHDRTAPTW